MVFVVSLHQHLQANRPSRVRVIPCSLSLNQAIFLLVTGRILFLIDHRMLRCVREHFVDYVSISTRLYAVDNGSGTYWRIVILLSQPLDSNSSEIKFP